MSGEPAGLLDARFLHRLEALALVARELASGSERGERASQHAGGGIAFAMHRPYAPGDDFRFVDWRLFARSERLYVKQFEEERDLTLHLLVDCSASMASGDGAKFTRARELAAALGYVALVNLDRVAVCPYAGELAAALPALRGRHRALLLLRQLAALSAAGETHLERAARSTAQRARRGGLSIVISDGFDPAGFVRGIDLLRHARLDPIALFVVDARDAEPADEGEITFVDGENGERRRLLVTGRTRERFRAAYHAHFRELTRALSERRVRAAQVDVSLPLERAVFELLRRTGVVA